MRKLRPEKTGLYRNEFEHDNCGIGFVAHLKGKRSHQIIRRGLETLVSMKHRGAEGSDSKTGDGAGVMIQIPRDFYLLQGYSIPPEGEFGTGLVFLPRDPVEAKKCEEILIQFVHDEGVRLIGFRDVPRDSSIIGDIAKNAEPLIRQILLGADLPQEELERRLYIIRKRAEKEVAASSLKQKSFFYLPSLSTRILIYKGMLTSEQLGEYFLDLQDSRIQSAIALVHSRFSTNTFPSWDLAQPFRMLAHNGEINTVKGNRFWMEARESILRSEKLGDLNKIYPVIEPGKSDSASLDNVLEFLVMSGKSLACAMSILIPESWNEKNPISPELKAFYQYHSTFMEPWDGPASLIFSDGRYIGGMLDRNGLRPSRYMITKDDLMVMGSETGVLQIPAEDIREKGRLKPGKLIMVDVHEGRIYRDKELKAQLASAHPYMSWIHRNMVNLEEIETGNIIPPGMGDDFSHYLASFNYSREDIETIIRSMADTGKEPLGSMGNDVPTAVLSRKPYRLFSYFKQHFAQVTNPPIDPIREELVMTLTGYIGSLQTNLLDESPDHVKMVKFKSPVINNTYFQVVRNLRYKRFSNSVIPMHFDADKGAGGLERAVDEICLLAEQAVDEQKNYIILTDRNISRQKAPIPSLLAVSAVHHHLIEKRKRMQIDIVVESAEPREVMHFALLFGYGASIINPYMSFAIIEQLVKNRIIQQDFDKAQENYIHAINKGLLKILSKMGISTLRSYRAAQIFEAVGIHPEVVNRYFKGTESRIGGIGMKEIAEEVLIPHRKAFTPDVYSAVFTEGIYSYRKYGEYHAWNPESVALLQWSTRNNDYGRYKEFTALVDRETARPGFLRGLLTYRRNPIPVEEVEPAENIVRRFVTGAMSYGSISREAHEALAIAMNRLGGRSNTGEGGEDPGRFQPLENGDSRRSSIKQVASGRFGVTTEYLVNADELQIKIAQGAKPGEGGQLPGHKVDRIIAKTRYSIPGITLISPPPHHDIYSIEDLAQLIFDLKNVNPEARISVKLVSETGVGTIAAGVAKASADLITISGTEGGTGASPASSIRHAGLPLEIGLSETQQTLVMNNLRRKVVLQADGQMKTGRDVIMAALLGAEEFGFATGALIVLGCVMMRKCHLNTCPVGVATQDPGLRKRFRGKADFVENYFRFVAREVREYLAELGFRSFDEIVGRSDLLMRDESVSHWKTRNIDLSDLIAFFPAAEKFPLHRVEPQRHKIDGVLDHELIEKSKPALEEKKQVTIHLPIRNTDRTTGAMLSGKITKKYGSEGLPEGTIRARFAGPAGQSFGAFLVPGVEFYLEGETNDYLGKGLSGGRIIVVPPAGSTFEPDQNIIIGNTVLYGATSGEAFISGMAGERFAVRNSGAIAVVEGVGDHCCEYMTGGRVVVLGKTGRNFAAGMSGGIAYVLDEEGDFDYYCNMGMVELSLVEDPHDIKELTDLISKHFELTGSKLAEKIMASPDHYMERFIKVIPYEYKKVIQEMKLANVEKDVEMIGDHSEVEQTLNSEDRMLQASRCMDCGIPFCHWGCPVDNLIPEWNELLYRGDWKGASDRLHSTNNFPEFTGRVCPAPCEHACVPGIYDEPVTIRENEAAIVEKAFAEGYIIPAPPSVRSGKSVAIIGSGPAGMAAADQLNRAGHLVTLFEKDEKIGGLLRFGIPDFKLNKRTIDRRLELMMAEGLEVKTGIEVGKDISGKEIMEQYDAVCLAIGSMKPRDLEVEGRELDGIHFAMEYLTQQNRVNDGVYVAYDHRINAKGRRVLVIGGGDTGSDCVGTAIRQKAAGVTQIEILPRPQKTRSADNPWPYFAKTLKTTTSHEEGCERMWSLSTLRFTGTRHRVTHADVEEVSWKYINGSLSMTPVPGTRRQIEADMILLALGFLHPVHGELLSELDVSLNSRNNIKVDGSMVTSLDSVFAAGDAVNGASLVVMAIASGRRAAKRIDEYLQTGGKRSGYKAT